MRKIFASLIAILFALNVQGASVTMCNFGVYQDDVYKYVGLVRTNGGAVGGTHLIYLNEFSLSCKINTNGVVIGNVDCLVFLGSDITTALTPFSLRSQTPITITNQGFVNGDLSAEGLTGNGSSYIQTGFIVPQNQFTNQAHASIYFTAVADDDQYDFGAGDGIILLGSLFLSAWSNGPTLDMYDNDTTRLTVGDSARVGLLIGLRANENSYMYNGNTGDGLIELATQGSFSSRQSPQVPAYLFAYNNNGSPAGHSTRRISFFSCGYGVSQVTGGNAQQFYNCVQRLQSRLGRAQ